MGGGDRKRHRQRSPPWLRTQSSPVTFLGTSCLSRGKSTGCGTDHMTLGKQLTSPGLGVLIGKMCVCYLNQMIVEVMERPLALKSDRPEVKSQPSHFLAG